MKGHLDYMRQMDTILVAVGVPTKEVPGASFVLPQTVKAAQTGVDDVEQQASATQNPSEEDRSCSEEGRDWSEVAETEETEDGWDIPDITDLLDSLNETESDNQNSVPNNSPPKNQETTQNNGLTEADQDEEHISWSWDDAQWTTERSHK